ncbi:MAG: hypothetical protein ACQEXJ_06090 [Myxococcota bacterium]
MSDEWIESAEVERLPSDAAEFATSAASRDEPIALTVSSMGDLRRLLPVVRSCQALLELGPDWDSYGARPPRPDLVGAAIQLIGRLMAEGAPAPHVLPTNRGGVQLEWARNGRELEVEVLEPDRFEVLYEEEGTDDVFEGEVDGDIRPILAQVRKLIAA